MKNQLNKYAIETAKSALSSNIEKKLKGWEKLNPIPVMDLSHLDLFDIAIKDPSWLAAARERLKRGYDPETCMRQILRDSPIAKSKQDKIDAKKALWNLEKENLLSHLRSKAEKLITTAIIEGMSGENLNKAIQIF